MRYRILTYNKSVGGVVASTAQAHGTNERWLSEFHLNLMPLNKFSNAYVARVERKRDITDRQRVEYCKKLQAATDGSATLGKLGLGATTKTKSTTINGMASSPQLSSDQVWITPPFPFQKIRVAEDHDIGHDDDDDNRNDNYMCTGDCFCSTCAAHYHINE